MSVDTVGSMLAGIAVLIGDALRIMGLADKRQWGDDEQEQVRLLEGALDEAKKDFQELSQLVNGQYYYENDRKAESLQELRLLRFKFDFHVQNFRDWARAGGPINPTWAKDTADLRRELHLVQCRAARRIFATGQEGTARCLGGFLVYRKQRAWGWAGVGAGASAGPSSAGGAAAGGNAPGRSSASAAGVRRGSLAATAMLDDREQQARFLEELETCNAVGKFERFGEQDVAFVCNFCDGYVVWEDLERMPPVREGQQDLAAAAAMSAAAFPERPPAASRHSSSTELLPSARTPLSPTAPGGGHHAAAAAASLPPTWRAKGWATSERVEKTIVFAPVAIANHVAPQGGEFLARMLCPYCEDYRELAAQEAGGAEDDDVGGLYGGKDEGFDDLHDFQEHLEWEHPGVRPAARPEEGTNCALM